MIGKRITPILNEVEFVLWEYEATIGEKPDFGPTALRSAVKIFVSVLMDKIWELQESEDISNEDRLKMVQKAGDDIRKLVKTYTNIDPHSLYE